MNGQIPQPENQVLVKPRVNVFKSTVLISLITMLVGFILGFLASQIIPVKNVLAPSSQKESILSSVPPKPTIDESKLPISLSLLTNPMIYQWSGSLNGKLIKKDDHTFTLTDDSGHSITITDIMPSGDKWKTVFLEKSGNSNKEISLETIPLGSLLRGDFYIFKNGPNTPVGGMFFKQ